MEKFILKTYNPQSIPAEPPVFYIAAKGTRAGRPRYHPWRNSFGFYCEPKDAVEYFQKILSMSEANVFKPYAVTGYMDYITIKSMTKAIISTLAAFDSIEEYIDRYYALVKIENTTRSKVALLEALKLSLLKSQ